MININSNWKDKEIGQPFLLEPIGKDYLWGGRRLKDDFSKQIEMVPLAETWECSTHPDGVSKISSGKNKGKTLVEVLKEHPEYIGKYANKKGQIPILIKLIDAAQDLSVQVHPDDKYAKEKENGSFGKSEMWYVLDAKKNAEIIYGFRHNIDEKKLRNSIVKGIIDKHLQHVKIKKDDIFYVEPGTVHGIGAGALIAEIQENSNLTYRLYDYNRVDKKGNKRELHIEKAMDVINLNAMPEPRQPMRMLKYQPGCAMELLCRCKYFQVERMLINTERCRSMAEVKGISLSFQVLLCTEGCGTVFTDKISFCFFKGDCIFVPAGSGVLKLHGKAQLLKIMC